MGHKVSDDPPVLIIHFPRPPSANRMFTRRMTRRGHRDLTAEYKTWRDTAGWIVKMQIVGFETIACRFRISIEVPRSRMDLDNHLKPILDLAQNLGIISNDANATGIAITPADRADCMAAFWPLAEAGIPAAPMKRTRPRSSGGMSLAAYRKLHSRGLV